MAKDKPDAAENPLNGYSAAIEAVIAVASGKSRSRLRLDAAEILLRHCSAPPWVDWGIEPLDDDE